jgi:DoxX-like family
MGMNVLLWVAQGVVAAVFLASGVMKLVTANKNVADPAPLLATPAQRLTMGAVDLLGAFGVVLPAATGILPVLTPVAAVGTGVVSVGATLIHGSRREPGETAVTAVLLVLSVLIAWGRFGPYPL